MATTFQYEVRDRAGNVKTGTLDAESQGAVASRLKEMGYVPTAITAASTTGMNKDIKIPSFGSKKVKLKDLAAFPRQFATMINSGLSLLRALTILCPQTENPDPRRVPTEAPNDVETGNALSASMGKPPKVFPPLMVNMT